MSNLNKETVLKLNANYLRLGFCSPYDAIVTMSGASVDGMPPALALDIHYNYDENGKPVGVKSFTPCNWEEWLLLEPREGDTVIHTVNRKIRVPSIIISPRYRKMPIKEERATPSAIRRRDGNRCQYTNVELTNKTFSLDHKIPKSKGGKDDWHNLVSCHKDVNSRKGNQFNEEIGLKLIKKIREPMRQPICNLVTDNKHIDHTWF